MGHIVWGVPSVLPIFDSHRSSAFLRVISLIDFVAKFTAVYWFIATIVLPSTYDLKYDLTQENRCLCPKV
jgi:hypothetical protein